MSYQSISTETTDLMRLNASRVGFFTAILTAAVTLITFAIAIATPPVSGPFCQSACVTYPYTNVVANVPRDYVWMVPALLMAPLFVALMVCIHHYAAPDRKIYSHIAVCFALLYAAALSVDYFIQLTVVQPALLNGESDGLALISQYNPHGIFIALESLGYVMMSLAFFCAAPVFAGSKHIERSLRWLFRLNALLVILTLIVLSLMYGYSIEYRFEVMVITVNWITLIVAGLLLSQVFRRAMPR